MAEPDNAQRAGQALTDLVRRPGESLGSYLVRAQSMTKPTYQRRAPDDRTALARLTGDMTSGISDNELEDWYMTLDEKTIPEHEDFKENVARTLGEQVFTVAPVDRFNDGVSGYEPASFGKFFLQNIFPQIEADYGTTAAAPEVQEQIVARLMGEPHDFQDENIKKYTTMVLDNLKEGQSADTFPAMTQEEADEAYAKYGTKARFYIGQENRDNFSRQKAYGLLQTFADGEHAPPLQGLSSAIAGTAGQMYTNVTNTFFPDGGKGYENAQVAADALGGPLGRIRQANKFYTRATEDPEFVRDPVTGANYADQSNLGLPGLGNHGAKSDGYYQYASNYLRNMWDNTKFRGLDPLAGFTHQNNQIQPPEVMSELNQHERMNNRTTPIVPGGRYVSETDDRDTSPAEEAANLFEGYKEHTERAFDDQYRERTGMNPTQFQSSMGNLLRNTLTDPSTLAGTVLTAGYGGLLGGLKGAVKPVTLGLVKEIGDEGLVTGGLESLLTGPSYFTEPLEGAGYRPFDPQDKALEAIEQSRKQADASAKVAAALMRKQRSPIGQSLLPQEQPPRRGRRPTMIQMPPKSIPENL